MSISIALSGELAVQTYTGLQEFLADHLELAPTVITQLPTLIRLAETRLARMITVPMGETTSVLATVAGAGTVALPGDFEQARNLRITGEEVLEFTTPNNVAAYRTAGRPLVWAIHGDNVLLGPVPDAVYSLTLRYRGKLTPLTVDTASNWLLANHPDAYVYMASAVICQHIENKDQSALYLAMTEAVVGEINEQGRRRRIGVPHRLRSPVVV